MQAGKQAGDTKAAALPGELAAKRAEVADAIDTAEARRKKAADALAEAEGALRQAARAAKG